MLDYYESQTGSEVATGTAQPRPIGSSKPFHRALDHAKHQRGASVCFEIGARHFWRCAIDPGAIVHDQRAGDRLLGGKVGGVTGDEALADSQP